VTRSALFSSSLRTLVAIAIASALFFVRSGRSSAADRPAQVIEPPRGSTLAGSWSASPLIEQWNVGDWGRSCGPRPTTHEVPGGPATVREEGPELVIVSTDRTFRTSDCYEQLPGVTQTSHSVTQRSWQTRCTSAPNDPRQTTLVTTVTATDNTLSIDETGAYQFNVQGQNCTASSRRTRNFRLMLRQGEVPPPPGVEPAPTATAVAQGRGQPLPSPSSLGRLNAGGRCTEVGEPTRLEVTPSRKLLKPGERFTFRIASFDANGCPVPARVTWAVLTPDAKVAIAPGGTVTVADEAEDGVVDLAVSFAGKSARVHVEVATPARYDALLSAASATDAGESDEPATIVASGSLSVNSAVAQDSARARKTTFVVIIGTLALGLAALGFVLLRRGAARSSVDDDPDAEPMAYGTLAAGRGPRVLMSAGHPLPARTVSCPSCRGEFAAGTAFCPNDGNRLIAGPLVPPPGGTVVSAGGICPTCRRGYDPGVRNCPIHGDDLVPAAVYQPGGPAPVVAERGKICPSCGGRYGGEATFCGKDGTALVLVN
jgi:hypothetical protein